MLQAFIERHASDRFYAFVGSIDSMGFVRRHYGYKESFFKTQAAAEKHTRRFIKAEQGMGGSCKTES